MKIFHVVPSLELSHGGPSRSVIALTDHLSFNSNLSIELMSAQIATSKVLPSAPNVVKIDVSLNGFGDQRFALAVRSFLFKRFDINPPDLIHIHGAWHPIGHWAAEAARKFDIPYIVQPRGMLEPWARKHKRLKKVFAFLAYQNNDLKCAAGFIATSFDEAENLKRLDLNQRIAVIPNGVDLPLEVRRMTTGDSKKTRTALFMSRIHPKKGILELLNAWSIVKPSGWKLRIVGPDDGGHLKDVLLTIKKLGLELSVEVNPEVSGADRVSEYINASVFILPTFSENFGMVIAEALSFGLPVITTKGAPWSSLVCNRCGWWIDVGLDPLVSILPIVLSLSDSELNAMGERGRALASTFKWTGVANDTFNFYLDLLKSNVMRLNK